MVSQFRTTISYLRDSYRQSPTVQFVRQRLLSSRPQTSAPKAGASIPDRHLVAGAEVASLTALRKYDAIAAIERRLRSAAAAITRYPLVAPGVDEAGRAGLETAFALGAVAASAILLTSCTGGAALPLTIAGLTAGKAVFYGAMGSAMFALTSRLLYNYSPNPLFNFGRKILPYTLIAPALLALGAIRSVIGAEFHDPASFTEATEIFRFAYGLGDSLKALGNFRETWREAAVLSLIGLSAFTIYARGQLHTLKPFSAREQFWKNSALFGMFSWVGLGTTLTYLCITKNSDFGQVFTEWSNPAKDFLFDAIGLGVLGWTYRDVSRTNANRLSKINPPSELAVVAEHTAANLQSTSKTNMFVYRVPMYLALIGNLFVSLSTGAINSVAGIAIKLALVAVTLIASSKYLLADIHSIFHSLGANRNTKRSLDAAEDPLISDAYEAEQNRRGEVVRVLKALKADATTEISISVLYTIFTNMRARTEHDLCAETNTTLNLASTRRARAFYEFVDFCREVQGALYQIIHEEYLAMQTNPGRSNAENYRKLAGLYRRLSADFSCETDGLIPWIRELEREDTSRSDRWFVNNYPQPWRKNLDQLLRKTADRFQARAEEYAYSAEHPEAACLTQDELAEEYRYLLDCYSMVLNINLRHILFHDSNIFNKIDNLANPHTFDGDTLYHLWIVRPDIVSPSLAVMAIPSKFIRIPNPHWDHTAKSPRFFWVDREDFKAELKYSGSWSSEVSLVDNTPADFQDKRVPITIKGKTLWAYPWQAVAEPLPSHGLIFRSHPDMQALDVFLSSDDCVYWVAGQAKDGPQRQTFMRAFETWAQKKFGKDYLTWVEKLRAAGNPNALWYVDKPPFTAWLGNTSTYDGMVSTLDEEHIPQDFRLEAKLAQDREGNPIVTVPYYYPIERIVRNAAPDLGVPRTIVFADNSRIELTGETK